MLSYPDFNQPFILHVDASTKGLGARLYQYKDKKVRIIGYGSRALTKAEQKYHSSKLEFLSLKWLFVSNFGTILHMKNRLKYIQTTILYYTYYHQQNLMQLDNDGLVNLLTLILIFITKLEEIIPTQTL